ncbi:MAG: DEAD/DEAH box helicase [Kiritimatiellae bacterium]|nr:DEAD/DEAH box helicase [Kiritimatiellia bacterium]
MNQLNDFTTFLENRFQSRIRAHRILAPAPGAYHNLPGELAPALRQALAGVPIDRLYEHQAEAFASVTSGRDTVLVSRTASGKTLSFFLPILHDYLTAEQPFSVLLLYPTKALSRDQEGTLGKLIRSAAGTRAIGTFDGDTPRDSRKVIQQSADFVITNPDMLHAGILPHHHRGWKTFLSRLKYIVVDEVHCYRGSFGSHVSNVFRRLLRVCDMHGSHPQFICSSATVGNPKEHVDLLFHRDFHLLDRDTAPRPQRDIYFVNPPLVQSAGSAVYRKGAASISIPLIRKATELGIRTICFCRARQEVERLYRAVTDGHPQLAHSVKPYRGGLLPTERRALERDLFDGKITTILTTNALELGIDIGDLDLCILSGHPGTIASFWQQAGRVGRKASRAVIVYIAKDSPIDQYIAHHPDFVTDTPAEQAWLNADNPYILLQHLPCAAHEYPLRDEEPLFASTAYPAALKVLADEKTLVPYHEAYRYALRDYPARGVNLRGLTDYNVDIHCGGEVIGEIDPIGARGTLYKDAIYQHLGKRYMSMDLDLEKKLCRVEEVEVDYYTEAVWERRVEMVEVDQETDLRGAGLKFGYVHVNLQPKMYKKIRERSLENIGYGPITLDPFEYDTTGLSLFPPKAWLTAMKDADARFVGAGLYGLKYLLKRSAPSLCMADENDIETDVSRFEENTQTYQSALYLYDAQEGGVGYAEKIFDRMEEALVLCRSILDDCECEAGCPSCVPPLPPGVEDEQMEQWLIESDAALACTRSLLDALIDGTIRVPTVTLQRHPMGPMIEPPPEDEEAKKLQARLERSADILRRKREKLH